MSEGNVRAGRLDQRVTIQRPALIKDSMGSVEHRFADVRDVWASVEPAHGYEVRQSMQEVAVLFVTISMRYGAAKDVLEGWQFLHKSATPPVPYEVKAISHVESGRRVIEFTCRTVDRTEK